MSSSSTSSLLDLDALVASTDKQLLTNFYQPVKSQKEINKQDRTVSSSSSSS